MIISKKELNRRIEEATAKEIERVHRDYYERERDRELDKRIDTINHNVWQQLRLIERRLDKLENPNATPAEVTEAELYAPL